METLLAALVGAGATVIVALIGVIGAYKLKIGVNQDRLIETLNFLINAQENKIKFLEDQARIYESKIDELVKKVDELERVVVLQAETIEKLSREADNKNISP